MVPFILRELSNLQMDFNVIFTYQTIESERNWFTDAGSRNWDTPLGQQALTASRSCPTNLGLPAFWNDIQRLIESTPPTRQRLVRGTSTKKHQ